MITLTFSAEDNAGLYKDLREFLNAEEPNAKPARASKKTAPEVAQPTIIEAPASTPTTAPAPTLDDVRVTITKVMAKVGKDKLVALLAEFGAKRGSEINAAKYAEFLTKANALLT